jgi:tripartite-type tricarboxylate transporter receptor subunit TctC
MSSRAIFWPSVVVLSLAAASAVAQTWPSRPITMVVAFPARGSDDILGRIVASRIAELLHQPVNVVNVSGGGGTTGAARVANAVADGHELILGTSATHALSQAINKTPPYNSLLDFAPVALMAEQPFVLVARPDLPAHDLQGFVAHGKSGRMQFGSAGTGSATHLVCAMLGAAAGMDGSHVSFNGGAPAMEALISARIDYFCPVVTIAIPQIQKQAIKAIAVLSRARTPVLPAVPTAAEQGMGNFTASTWFGLFLPKGTPAPVVHALQSATTAALDTPSVRAQLQEIGAEVVDPDRRSPDYLRQFLEKDIEKWRNALKAAGL